MALSAGILVHRLVDGRPEVLLGHPGGPLWRKRAYASWSIPKGRIEPGEAPLAAAIREFTEETGLSIKGPFRALTPIQQTGGKVVYGWAAEASLEPSQFAPGVFEMEWPPRSGRSASFPEIDQLQYFSLEEALGRILPSQAPLIWEAVGISPGPSS